MKPNRFQVGDIVRLHSSTAPQKVTQVHNAEVISTEYLNSSHINHYRSACDFTFHDHIPKEEPKTMTKSNENSLLVSLLQAQRGITTASIRISGSRAQDPFYTYKVRPGLELTKGDRVLVECGSTQKVGEVKEVHEIAQIDPEADYDYRWVFQKLDTDWIQAIKDEEKNLRLRFVQASMFDKLKAAGIDFADVETPLLGVAK